MLLGSYRYHENKRGGWSHSFDGKRWWGSADLAAWMFLSDRGYGLDNDDQLVRFQDFMRSNLRR
jgi:hypothetical protein